MVPGPEHRRPRRRIGARRDGHCWRYRLTNKAYEVGGSQAQRRSRIVLAWLTVVARYEAYRLVRDYRQTSPASCLSATDEEGNVTAFDPDHVLGPERDPLADLEVREALAALAALKPAQRTTLALKVAGYRYKEIQELCGGKTYTWVNRHLTEGRAALRAEGAAEAA